MAENVDKNVLYYGDTLAILPFSVQDETMTLMPLNPPFTSAQTYPVLFAEHGGSRSAAQIKAYEATRAWNWAWNIESEAAYQDVLIARGKPSLAMKAATAPLSRHTCSSSPYLFIS